MMDADHIQSDESARGLERLRRFAIRACLVGSGLVLLLLLVLAPPVSFPAETRIEVPRGVSAAEAAQLLAEHDVVRSRLALQVALRLFAGETGVQAGAYWFDMPIGTLGVARALSSGAHSLPLAALTVPEGLHIREMDALVAERLGIPEGAFAAAAEGKEGYLFPETYHIPEDFTAEELVQLMYEESQSRFSSLDGAVERSGRTLEEIVTMASILEREARSEESMRIVAGILWRRYDTGMRLQVDASFVYLLGKASDDVTREDLALDSPYNTYRYAGLPPTPIANPGQQSLMAALDPLSSPYLFYLTDTDGVFHYARTYEEHQENVLRYLNPD